MKRKLIFTSLLSVVAGFALFTCNTETTAEEDSVYIELEKTHMQIKAGTHKSYIWVNPKTQCMYLKGANDKGLNTIAEQEYVYDINGGKCVGPYQREYNSKK